MCIGSNPIAIKPGNKMGVSIIIAGVGSINVPTKRRNTFSTSNINNLLSVNENRKEVNIYGTCSAVNIHANKVAVLKSKIHVPLNLAALNNIPGMSFNVNSLCRKPIKVA